VSLAGGADGVVSGFAAPPGAAVAGYGVAGVAVGLLSGVILPTGVGDVSSVSVNVSRSGGGSDSLATPNAVNVAQQTNPINTIRFMNDLITSSPVRKQHPQPWHGSVNICQMQRTNLRAASSFGTAQARAEQIIKGCPKTPRPTLPLPQGLRTVSNGVWDSSRKLFGITEYCVIVRIEVVCADMEQRGPPADV